MGKKSKKNVDTEVETTTESGFSEFDLDERLLKAIGELGWEKPTQVQESLIPLALQGKNILARARTGSGKTGAFLLPIIQNVLQLSLNNEKEIGPFAVFIAPTKELAGQIFKLLQDLISSFPFLQAVNFAEMDEDNVAIMLNEVTDMIVSTPGRLVNAIQTKNNLFKNVRHVVLDEADLLLSFGYKDEMEKIKESLPKNYQSIFTSATLDEDMDDIKSMFLTGPSVSLKLKEGQLPNNDQLTQYHINCNNEEEKFAILISLIKLKLIVGKTIIFVANTDRCYKLHLFLNAFKIPSCVLNAQMPANCRCHVVQEFNEGKYQFIIASDMKDMISNEQNGEKQKKKKNKKKNKDGMRAHDKESGVARGIDFHFVSNVINFDFPKSTDVYIHRVGRTARGFNKGTAISFSSLEEKEKTGLIQKELEELLGEGAILPYQIRMQDFEGFQLRARDALNACTRTVIKETRLKEIKQEILRSKQLEAYFAKNPRERQIIENDKKIVKMNVHSTAIADVPEYIVPKPLRGQDFSLPTTSKGTKRKQHNKAIKSKRLKLKHDPLRTFKF